ncbi:WD40 repeat domain-containing protein [Streptomyces sp. NPDC091280]|uniref:WD40 repeat domain-containing protein n=1 Tax=Streptomyces sp. NPDC091280 TaxID=3365984 RepID=UPI003828C2CB
MLRTLPPLPVPRTGRALARATRALLAFSPGSDTLAYGVSAPGVPTAPQRVALWDLVRDHPRTTLDLTDPASEGTVTSLALGPNGRSLYAVRTPTTGEPGDEAWDTARHRRTAVYRDVAGTDLAVSPDGRLLVGADHVVRLPLGPVRVHGLVRGDGVGALAFAQDGSLLAVGDRAGRVTLWDGSLEHRAGVLRTAFPAPLGASAEAVSALAVSPDGRTLAVGGDAGTLQLWDIATQQPLGDPLTTPGDAISSLAFAPDSTTVYATGAHAPLQRYDIRADRAVDTICARTGEAELTRAQWHTYVPDAPYREVCGH